MVILVIMEAPPWFCDVISAQKKEAKIKSTRWIQMATFGLDNTPRVRNVVFRGWSDSFQMQIFTDKRSQKYSELESNNNVEICWFFSKCKSQFRFRGRTEIDLGIDTDINWNKLDNKSQSMWGWPNPGEKYDSEMNNQLIQKNKFDNFILLKINIISVDQLILNRPIHIRRRWLKSNEWIVERINP